MAEGISWTKREIRNEAAKIIKKLRLKSYNEDVLEAQCENIPTSDAVAELRDLCVRSNYPFPVFDLVWFGGPPTALEFKIKCSVVTISKNATASTEKEAKQLAAQKVIKIIRQESTSNSPSETASLEQMAKEFAKQNRKKIKIYRDYAKLDIKYPLDLCIIYRHNFFKNLETEKRTKAYNILNFEAIASSKDKVDLVLKALQIPYKVEEIPAKNWDSIILIELKCDLDVMFAGKRDYVYDKVIEYLQDMLK